MANFGERTVVGRIPVSGSTEVRVSESSKDGKPCVDIRLFYADMSSVDDLQRFAQDKPAGCFLPTKKGIFLEVSQFQELMEDMLIPLHKKYAKK